VWHLGIPRKRKGFLDWNFEGIGVNAVWNSKCMGWGVSALNFQRGKLCLKSLI